MKFAVIVFVLGKPFLPSLIVASKAWTLYYKLFTDGTQLGLATALLTNIRLVIRASKGQTLAYLPRVQCYKNFTSVIYVCS
jgi:hypothetical protein